MTAVMQTVGTDGARTWTKCRQPPFGSARQRGWRTGNKKPVKNRDLWRELFALVREREIEFEKVEAHSGHEWNELADELAVEAARRPG